MTTILSALFGLSLFTSAHIGGPVDITAWTPQAGDRIIVDTRSNVGYFVRESGEYAEFPVLTGQRRVVHYIGRTYNAATPNKRWTARSIDVKGRSMTFGETGTFVRLYDGEERTAYGIHSHLTFKKMLAEGDRYRSMGCILVDEGVLTLVTETFELNGGTLDIVTTEGVDLPEPTQNIAEKPGWLGL